MITRSVLLYCDPDHAWALFVERAGDWWPAQRRHTADPGSRIIFDAGGRFYERSADGVEVELGAIVSMQRPRRLALDWYPGTGPDAPTRVEVSFEPEGDGTRVTVRHGAGRAGDERFRHSAPAFDRSWTMVLDALRPASDASSPRPPGVAAKRRSGTDNR